MSSSPNLLEENFIKKSNRKLKKKPCDACESDSDDDKHHHRSHSRGKGKHDKHDKHEKHEDHEEKKCDTVCKTDCCKVEKRMDCCSLPYQRLAKLSTGYSMVATTGGLILPTDVVVIPPAVPPIPVVGSPALFNLNGMKNRAGMALMAPNAGLFTPPTATSTKAVDLVLAASATAETITVIYDNAYYGYNFVNTHRYLTAEACGKPDQVYGWYFDTADGQLQLFHSIGDLNLPLSLTRKDLLGISNENLTSLQKDQMKHLNNLYKLSVNAIDSVGSVPKTEGNMLKVCDKAGDQWLVCLNRASSLGSICDEGTKYVIVAIPLC